MKKILFIIDHYPISPRMVKTVETLKSKGFSTKILAWNREGRKVTLDDKIITYNQKIGYGKKIKKFTNLISFGKKIKSVIKEYNPDYIHSVDFEMQFLSYIYSKRCLMVYEIYDIKFFSNKFINQIRHRLEKYILKKVSFVVYASPFFNKYYALDSEKYVVINNKPDLLLSSLETTDDNLKEKEGNTKTKIGFVGTVRYFNEFKIAFDSFKNKEDFDFLIYGSGPDLDKLKEYALNNNINNVSFYGRFESSNLPIIYKNIDFVWACYPKNDLNVRYAVSNKYFESLAFKTPILVSNDTYLGDLVEKNKTGLAIDSSKVEGVISGLDRLSKDKESYISRMKKLLVSEDNFWKSEQNLYNFYYRLEEL